MDEHQEHHHASEHIEHEHAEQEKKEQKSSINYWKIGSMVLGILLVVSVFTNGFNILGGLSKEEASTKALTFVNQNLLQGQAVAQLGDTGEEAGVYSMDLTVSGREIKGYVTKDGKLFFPQAINLDENPELLNQGQQQQAPAEVPKSAKPEVELYVFTYCPYGLQMEKAAAPVVKLLGNKMDFKIRQIGAMHGAYEAKEAKRQLCVNKEYPKKFWDYLTYFAIDTKIGACRGDEACLEPLINGLYNKLSIDGSKIDTCMASAGEELYSAEESNSQTKGVGGSPTIIINGAQSQVGRNPEAIKKAVCSAFTTEPAECKQTLSTENASPGFGSSTGADAAAAASCG